MPNAVPSLSGIKALNAICKITRLASPATQLILPSLPKLPIHQGNRSSFVSDYNIVSMHLAAAQIECKYIPASLRRNNTKETIPRGLGNNLVVFYRRDDNAGRHKRCSRAKNQGECGLHCSDVSGNSRRAVSDKLNNVNKQRCRFFF